MAHDTHFETRSQAQYEYDRAQNAKHMRKQVTQFAIMIMLTFVAFAAVVADFSPYFIKPLILLLAGVQVVQQLYSFMHMDEKMRRIWVLFNSLSGAADLSPLRSS